MVQNVHNGDKGNCCNMKIGGMCDGEHVLLNMFVY